MKDHLYVPGHEGGPGRKSLTENERTARNALRQEIADAMLILIQMNPDQLKEAIQNNLKNWNIVMMTIARSWQKSIATGDSRPTQYWIDRILGKPKEHMRIDDNRIPSIVRKSEAQQWMKTLEERARQEDRQMQWPAGNLLDA